MVTKKRPVAKKPTPKKKCPLGVCKKGGTSSRGGGVAKRPPSNPLPTPPQPNKPKNPNTTPPKPPLDTVKHNNMEDEYTEDDISDDEKEVVTRSSLLNQQIGQTVKQTIKGALIGGASAAAAGCVQGSILGAPLGVGGAIAGCTNHGFEAAKKGALYGAGVGAATGLSRTVLEQSMFEPKHPDKSLRKARRIADVVDKTAYTAATVYGGYKAYKGLTTTNNVDTPSDSKPPKQIMNPIKTQERVNKLKKIGKNIVKAVNKRGQVILESNTLQTVANYVSKPVADIIKAINKDRALIEAKKKGAQLRKEEANRIVSDIVDKMVIDTMDQIAQKEQSKMAMEGVIPIPTVKEASKAYEDYSKTAEMWDNLKAKSRGVAPMEVSTSPVYTNNRTSPQPQLQSLPPQPPSQPPSPSLSSATSMATTSPTLPPLPPSPSLSDISMDTASSTLTPGSPVSPMLVINQAAPSPTIANVVPGTTPAQAIIINKRKRIGTSLFDPTGFYQGYDNNRKSRRLNEALVQYGPSQLPSTFRRRRNVYIPSTAPVITTSNKPKRSKKLISPPPSPSIDNLPPVNVDRIIEYAQGFYTSLGDPITIKDKRYKKLFLSRLTDISILRSKMRAETDPNRREGFQSLLEREVRFLEKSLQAHNYI